MRGTEVAQVGMSGSNDNRAWTGQIVSAIGDTVHGWLVRVSARQPDAAPTARTRFEARYENELFLADEMLSRGGAASPEDHVWVNRLLTAYEAASDSVYDPSHEIPDPWAEDTQAEVFETEPELPATDAGQLDIEPETLPSSDADDPIAQARELREEAARVRKELRPALAALAHEREQVWRAVRGMRDMLRNIGRRDK